MWHSHLSEWGRSLETLVNCWRGQCEYPGRLLPLSSLSASSLPQWRRMVLGQGTCLQGVADIDISICVRCLFISLSERRSAGGHPPPTPPTPGGDSRGLSFTISQCGCHSPHGKHIIWTEAVYEWRREALCPSNRSAEASWAQHLPHELCHGAAQLMGTVWEVRGLLSWR